MASIKGNGLCVTAARTINTSRAAYDRVHNYADSRNFSSLPMKLPEWDTSGTDPESNVMRIRLEMEESTARMRGHRRMIAKKRNVLDSNWQEIRDTEQTLNRSCKKFNAFVIENKDKVKRARETVNYHLQLQDILQTEIQELQETYDHLLLTHQTVTQNINSHKIYERFLDNVVAKSPNFSNIDDTLKRYVALKLARETIARSQAQGSAELQKIREALDDMSQYYRQRHVQLNRDLLNLQAEHDKAKGTSYFWEKGIVRVQEVVALNETIRHALRLAAYDIYRALKNKLKKHKSNLPPDATEQHWQFVKEAMNELKIIVDRAKKLADKEAHLKRTKEAVTKKR